MSIKPTLLLAAASLATLNLHSSAFGLQLNDTSGCTMELIQNNGLNSQAGASGNDLVNRIVILIDSARTTLVVAAHEIDHPTIIEALKRAAARGVSVRVYADAKDILQRVELRPEDGALGRSVDQRNNLERLMRGSDGVIATADDIHIQAEAPIEAVVKETGARIRSGLPETPEGIPRASYSVSSYVFADTPIIAQGTIRRPTQVGELPSFKAPATTRMHHKFIVVDGEKGVTGSFNFTVSGAEGSQFDAMAGAELGHRQQMIFFENVEMAGGYVNYFNALWGGPSGPASIDAALREPAPGSLDFDVTNCGFPVRVLFLPNKSAASLLIGEIEKASSTIQFEFFAFEEMDFIRAIYKQVINKRVEVRGIIDERFFSAFADAVRKLGPDAERFFLGSLDGESRVEKSKLFRLLHSKTMIVDGMGGTNPLVITGSANLSINAFEHNRENLIMLKSQPIASVFVHQLKTFIRASRLNRVGYCSSLQRLEDTALPKQASLLTEDD